MQTRVFAWECKARACCSSCASCSSPSCATFSLWPHVCTPSFKLPIEPWMPLICTTPHHTNSNCGLRCHKAISRPEDASRSLWRVNACWQEYLSCSSHESGKSAQYANMYHLGLHNFCVTEKLFQMLSAGFSDDAEGLKKCD